MIKNFNQLVNAGGNREEKNARRRVLAILEHALEQSDPYFLTFRALKKINFKKYRRVFVVGAGKGTYRMALAAEQFLGKRLKGGLISAPAKIKKGELKKIKLSLAGHPFPNQGSVNGAMKTLSLVKKAEKGDLVLALFSGGASSLLCAPPPGVSLEEKKSVSRLLLRSGANINEVNAVRKHLSRIKGGWLAKAAGETDLISFYLSDVVGNDLSTIASGPTAADKTTFGEAIKILKERRIWDKIPANVKKRLSRGAKGIHPETPKFLPLNIKNIIIGSHKTLAEAAARRAKKFKFKTTVLTDKMAGQTEKKGIELMKKATVGCRKALFIASGETNFKVRTDCPGGRNQQMVLAILPKIKTGQVFLAFDSDGVDGVGPEKIGGAIADSQTLKNSRILKIDIGRALAKNDSYNFFKKAGGQIKTGYVGTNLGDIVLILNRSDFKMKEGS